VRTTLLLGSGLGVAATLVGAQRAALAAYPGLLDNWVYAGLAALAAALGVWFLACGFLAARRWPASRAPGVLVLLGASALAVAGADAYVLMFRVDTAGTGGHLSLTHRNWLLRYVEPHRNARGYWERDLAPFEAGRAPGTPPVVAVVGDSFTWGQGMPGAEFRFTNIAQAKLRARGQPVDVLNFGRGGAHTRTVLAMLDDVAAVHPDVVVYAYLSNDIETYLELPRVRYADPWLGAAALRLSPIYNFVHWRLTAPRRYAEAGRQSIGALLRAYQDVTILGRHLEDLDHVIERIEAMSARPMLALLPLPTMWVDSTAQPAGEDAGARRRLRDRVYGVLADRAASRGAPVVHAETLEDAMPLDAFVLSRMDAHPSKAAHEAIAAILAEALVRQGVLTR